MSRSVRPTESRQGQGIAERSDRGEEQYRDPRTPLLLRPGEAATALGVGRTTVYELIHAGVLPTVHIGRAVRIPMREVTEFVDQQTTRKDVRLPSQMASS